MSQAERSNEQPKVPLNLLHYCTFVALAEEENFGRAALRLGVTRGAVSQQLRMLERDLGGVRLVDRDQGGMTLTTAGRAFLGDARRALAFAERAAQAARSAQSQ